MAMPRLLAAAAVTTLCVLFHGSTAVSVAGEGEGEQLETEGESPYAEFEAYVKKHGRHYEPGSEDFLHRHKLFEARLLEVNRHNSVIGRLWQAGPGPFADYTEAQRLGMRGYRHWATTGGASSGGTFFTAEALRERELLRPRANIPEEFDWLNLTVAHPVLDQGQCGSCWAVASKSVLDAHYEIHVKPSTGVPRNFSAQQIVTCIPNPNDCGGTGGCGGSTVELAMAWVLKNGCATEGSVPYKGVDMSLTEARCNESEVLSTIQTSPTASAASSDLHGATKKDSSTAGGTAFGMHGYHMLERNKYQPLMEALYQHGPVATSTAAGPWFEYSSGIFDGCDKNVIVDHAVTLYGFGQASVGSTHSNGLVVLTSTHGKARAHVGAISGAQAAEAQTSVTKYWLIRNSWGPDWGEQGFIRMKRLGDGANGDEGHCGTDSDNSQGTGCHGDAAQVQVCGMCGFLWDSVVPHFNTSTVGSLAEKSTVEMDPSGKLVRRESAK